MAFIEAADSASSISTYALCICAATGASLLSWALVPYPSFRLQHGAAGISSSRLSQYLHSQGVEPAEAAEHPEILLRPHEADAVGFSGLTFKFAI